MLVSAYLATLRERLFDPSPGAGWSDADLIGNLNEAIRATCSIKPDAYTLQADIALAAGVVQTLPAAGIALFDITQNTTSGRMVSQVDRSMLDAENRFWPAATQEVDVQHFTTDALAPTRYYVTPPNAGTGSVKALYGALPTAVSATTDDVLLSDVFQPALLAYTLSRAWMKPGPRKDPAASAAAFNEWATLVGAKTKAQVETAPRVSAQKGM